MPQIGLTVRVTDDLGGVSAPSVANILVVSPPIIDSVVANPSTIPAGGQSTITITAHSPDGRPLTYTVTPDSGTAVATAQPNVFTYTAP